MVPVEGQSLKKYFPLTGATYFPLMKFWSCKSAIPETPASSNLKGV
jgi:hypothetical protein